MKEKLLPVLVALLMLSSVFVALVNQKESIVIKAEASGGGSTGTGGYEPIINYTYVWHKTQNLSYIVKEHPKGRAFGTKGERIAANYIWQWMNETLDPKNVTRDPIDKKWMHLGHPLSYIGPLYRKRVVLGCYINITAYNKVNGTTIYKNLSIEKHNCFPLLKAPPFTKINKKGYVSVSEGENIPITKKLRRGSQILLLHAHWKEPYGWGRNWSFLRILLPNVKAFILVDWDFNETYFMSPSRYDYRGPLAEYPKPGFSISGKDGRWLEEKLNDENYTVTATFKSVWKYDDVESYNVIGKLEGRSPSKVDIICAHYDCWWNQGAIDEAAETALVLGIAKYMKKLEEEKGIKPEHTVKFIAFAGEEFGYRGSKDYIVKYIYNGNEKVRYVVNPGNFGHIDSIYLPKGERDFTFCVDKTWVGNIASRVAHSLEYENWIKNLVDNESRAWGTRAKTEMEAEDGKAFHAVGASEHTIIFGRGTFKGYHRDGDNHNKGDVLYPNDPFCGLVNDTFTIESDIVLLTALYLCYEDVIKENLSISDYSLEFFDRGNDGKNDSVRFHFDVTTAIPTGAKIKATLYRIIHLLNKTILIPVNNNCTDYFLVKDGDTASGYVTVRTISERIPGNFTIKIKLYDVNGTLVDEIQTESFYLNLLDVPIADFVSSPDEPTDIDNMTFDAKDLSYPSAGNNASIVNYTWDFGDGCYGYGCNVTHRYADDGYYDVTLTIYDSNGKNATKTKRIYVRNIIPSPLFSIEPSQIMIVGKPVYFNSTVYEPDGYIVNYTWDFGDGSYAYTQNATHIYTKSGIYTVKLTVRDDDNATGTREKTIWVFDGFVDDDYPRDDPANRRWRSIQNAINDLDDGAMIYVYNGTYNESLFINKTIKLYGENAECTIIRNNSTVISILENGSLYISNFTITDGSAGIESVNGLNPNTVENCKFYGNEVAINFAGTNSNTIFNTTISSGREGIKLTNSMYNSIIGCSFQGLNNAIYIENSKENLVDSCSFRFNYNTIYMYNSDNNTVQSCYMEMKHTIVSWPPVSVIAIQMINSKGNDIITCNIFNSTDYAIYMVSSSNNSIAFCNICENGAGIYLMGSSNNAIIANTLYNNTLPAIIIDRSSKNNTIYHNNFIMNGLKAGKDGAPVQAYDDGERNTWYLAGPDTLLTLSSRGEGNYWFDYQGTDADGDGVGDTPYNISGSAHSKDMYPLVGSCKWSKALNIKWGSRDDPWVRMPLPWAEVS